jgi:hypothetical protein
MARLTEKEAEYWDEYFTQNDPELEPSGTGYLSQWAARQMGLDDLTMKYLTTKSAAEHVSLAKIIGDLVRHEIATA